MSQAEIPLLRESAAFSRRLIAAARRFADSAPAFHRRVNWSYRYGEDFYAREAACFVASPADYLKGEPAAAPELADVFERRLGTRAVAGVVVKVVVHRLFNLLGRAADRGLRRRGTRVYRKCYVDDIELVFDASEPGVVRGVYPFPISVGRQLRYLRFLRDRKLLFKLDGTPYLLVDLVRFMIRRDVGSLARMESRAQTRQAMAIACLGMTMVQLSDEFDIGSLAFTRMLARMSVFVVNSAHGVGKYFPVHAYPEFHILTRRQEDYYHAIRPCRYIVRRLNDTARPGAARRPADDDHGASLRLVVLSQNFGNHGVIADNESTLLAALRERFAGCADVRLLYKPHPNRSNLEQVPGFEVIRTLESVNDREGTIFVSFFSTCQVDPTFKGLKILLRGNLIHPEIAFDESEPVLDVAELLELVEAKMAAQRLRTIIEA